MTVRAIKSWVYEPVSGTVLPVLTAAEARLLLDFADHERAAGTLSDEDWETFRNARDKLLVMERLSKA